MIILEKPYVSDFLVNSIIELSLPVLRNSVSEKLVRKDDIYLLDEEEFRSKLLDNNLMYTNSESSFDWICNNLKDYEIIEKINLMKDKAKFRNIIKQIYPNFYFQEVKASEIGEIEIEKIKKPFILKPSVGFFSIGVYKIIDDNDWQFAMNDIKNNIHKWNELYSNQVIDNTKFILEEYIEGDEFAIDGYYDKYGEPVILNILKHDFSSESDVSDRIYYTSKEIIEEYEKSISNLLKEMNKKLNLKQFPFHMEVRVDKDKITPIEINPMRFAGWCTTDIAYYAYGINVYKYFFENLKPDFKSILQGKEEKIYSIIILDKPTSVCNIKSFNYERLIDDFERVLELRKIDFNIFPIFGFLFTETSFQNKRELKRILSSDLLEYIELE